MKKITQTLGLVAGTVVTAGCIGVPGYAVADGAVQLPTSAIEVPTPTPPQDVATVVTDTTLTLAVIEGAEYSLDGDIWQDSNIFTGLQPATEYTIYIRIKSTEDTPASEVTEVKATTDKSVQVKPVVDMPEVTADTISFAEMAGLEFSINNGATWQDSNIFEGLTPNTQYTILVRLAETATQHASEAVSFELITAKYEQAMPTEQTNSNFCEPTSITVGEVLGAEYSLDGVHYQESNVFTDLEVNTEYLVYIRYPETDTHYASEPYTVYISTVKYSQSAPAISDAEEITPNSITMPIVEGVEYSLGGEIYDTDNYFENLQPNTYYDIYARYAEDATHYAGESVLISIQTPKYTQDAPVISLVEATTDSITVTPLENCEYSINGTTWQDGNIFNNLTDNTSYTIYARYKETSTQYQSPNSSIQVNTLILKTEQEAPIANDVGIKYFDGNTLEVHNKSGANYEYAIAVWTNSGNEFEAEIVTDWQTSTIFENVSGYFEKGNFTNPTLKNGKVLYRYPETETQNASPSQNAINWINNALSINADDLFVVDGIWYTIIDDSTTVQVEGCSIVDGVLNIPENITVNDIQYPVVKINYVCPYYSSSSANYFLSEIKEIYIPKSITEFKDDGGTFANCKKLEKFYYNGSVTQVYHGSAYDFAGTGSDTTEGVEIIIGPDVTNIPNDMFYTTSNRSANIKSVTFLSESKVTLNFTSFNYAEVPVFYVQDNLVETYKADNRLSNYQDKIKSISEKE